jgi:tetratricopeptide (TPR) repeat protein
VTAALRTLLRVLAALAVLLAIARGASADDKATKAARKHFDKGEKLYALGRFDEALVEYEAAFEAKPLPGFLFNIGQCHRNLGDYDAAIFSFRKYLSLAPEAENREAVLELIDDLEAQKERDAEEARRRKLDEPPPPKEGKKSRFYTKWWFWGGVAAVAGAGAGTYFLLRDDGTPDSDLGNVVFR